MKTVSQREITKADSRTVRIRKDVWKYVDELAYQQRETITDVLDKALREHFKLPAAA